jgi:Lar family restriction alleviation protein
MSELKPCPFCGCKTIRMHYSNNGAHSIYCNNCNVETCTSGGTDRCVTEWNTRAPQSEWISVSDRLPDADGRYLIVSHGGNIVTRMFYTHHDKSFFNRVIATHWMPLPLPPKEDLPC